MKENVIKTKRFAFSLRIIKLYPYLQSEKKEFILSKQLMRSGSSIGAMIRESEQAESKLDFMHKLAIHKNKPMKQNIGLNYRINQDKYKKISINMFFRIIEY